MPGGSGAAKGSESNQTEAPIAVRGLVKMKRKIQASGAEVKAIRDKGASAQSVSNDRMLFKGMYQTLETTFQRFNEHFEGFFDYCEEHNIDPKTPSKEDENYFAEIKKYYYEAHGFYQALLEKTSTRASLPAAPGDPNQTLAPQYAQARHILPKVKIKPFSGDLTQWSTFKEMFSSLVKDDPSLSDVERFHFLTSYLEGEAYDVIKHIKVCEANFPQAWQALLEAYDNDRKLACTYLERFLSYRPPSGKPTVDSLQQFLANVSESVTSLQNLEIPHFGEYLLCELALKSLDSATREAFEVSIIGTKYPRFSELKTFVQNRCQVLRLTSTGITNPKSDHSSPPLPSRQPKPKNPNNFTPKGSTSHMLMARSSKGSQKKDNRQQKSHSGPQDPFECVVCKGSHTIRDCIQFKNSSPEQRLEFLKDWQGCHNCLHPRHGTADCPSSWHCRLCSERHHSMLHLPSAVSSSSPQSQSHATGGSGVQNDSRGFIGASTTQSSHGVLLGTITALLKNSKGEFQRYRGIVDPGSQFSAVTAQCAKELGRSTRPYHGNISGVNNSPITNIAGKISLVLRPASSPTLLETDAVVIPSITSPLPHVILQSKMWADYLTYDLSDPEFIKPGEISFLIGADLYPDIVTGTPITIHKKGPKLLGTIFGYTVMGRYIEDSLSSNSNLVTSHIPKVSLLGLDQLPSIIERFWEVEEPNLTYELTPEDQACENHFITTHRRDKNGRYIVSLPFKSSNPKIIPNCSRVLSRFKSLESRFAKEPQLKSDYAQFMDEYIRLGHMSLANTEASYIIPHHAVYKVDPNGKGKLRVVFDGSFRTPTGSINEHLHVGPKLQSDMADIVLRFRKPAFVLTCDVVKMFRQILVSEPDRCYQQIIWRANPNEELAAYELNTVTYGLRCSPYLSQRVLKQLVTDEGDAYPAASAAILHSTYVDDIAHGSDSVEGLFNLKTQLVALLSRGGFELSKWNSNHSPLLEGLAPLQEPVQLGKEATPKILGMQWDPQTDTLSYQINKPTEGFTKRIVSSNIGRLFDPLGYLTPVTFLAKCIFQETWKAGIGWDDDIAAPLKSLWAKFTNELPSLANLRIPRALPKTDSSYQLLCFSDASEKGYCAAIYLRATCGDAAWVTLLKAKSRLAPLKALSIPRLELEGAVLLSRLLKNVQPTLDSLDIRDVFCFTDSMVVLAWLKTPPHALKMFVANRVQRVIEATEIGWWHHIKGTENPADVGSRGVMPSILQDHALWWAGPPWCTQPIQEWPISQDTSEIGDLPELKTSNVILVHVNTENFLMGVIGRFSSFQRLIRVIAYVRRFITNARIPKRRRTRRRGGDISSMEFYKAQQVCVKIVQYHYHPEAFKPDNFNHLPNELRQLAVFVDHEGVLRVGGRLAKAPLDVDQKHPVFLPARAHLTRLIVAHYHKINHHAGPSALMATIRQKFWIPRARNLVKEQKGRCVTCVRFSKAIRMPFMGNLPGSRFASTTPFAQTGIDLAGPFLCKDSARRKNSTHKVWLCVFVCLSTRAVHLELVTGLSVEAFLDAFDRFVARRGLPTRLFSDCGTNFIGASGYIKEVMAWFHNESTQDSILRHTCHLNIEWSFNPPSAPHFGGGWEAAVKSAKSLLYKIFGDHPYSSNELSTIFTKIEAILNSRPLTPLSDSPQDPNPLTPGHFLIGQPLTALPEPDLSDIPCNRLDRWQLLRERIQHFWNRWRDEYITTLQRREKWNQKTPNLKVGDIVLITDARPSPALWPMARVVQVHPGDDGTVRVATVKTSKGLYKRPIVKLVPLPINDKIQ